MPLGELAVVASNCGFVAAGATCGALSRYGCAEACKLTSFGASNPHFATLCVNVAGSFLLGCIAGAVRPGSHGALLAGTGFCGAFTTFSTYAVDAVKLAQAGQLGVAGLYVAASNIASIGAVAAGLQLSTSPSGAAAIGALLARRPALRKLFPPPALPKG